jgi:hypothetical protein
MPLRHWGKPVQFPVQSKGAWLAILRLKVVSTTPLKRPDCFAPDCVRARSPKAKNISARAINRPWIPRCSSERR